MLVVAVIAHLLAQPCEQPSATGAIWLNSLDLATCLAPSITGIPPAEVGASPVRPTGEAILTALAQRGLTLNELFATPSLVAGIVLASAPPRSYVIPTEEYYYFEMFFEGRWIGGNLRFTDTDAGVLHCGYYLREQPRVSNYAALSALDGLCISEVRQEGRREIHVLDEKTGARADFLIPPAAAFPFRDALPLEPGEEVISPIIDESGVAFLLVYDRERCVFSYLLAATAPDDPLAPLDADGTWQGTRSGFLYVTDRLGRHLLAGVREEEVRMNTFHDGPFDQVPPRLNLRERLLQAFPRIEERRNDRLDAHGNWQGASGIRVAITPYLEYADGEESRVARRFAAILGVRRAFDGSQHASAQPAIEAPGTLLHQWSDIVLRHARDWPMGHAYVQSVRLVQPQPSWTAK